MNVTRMEKNKPDSKLDIRVTAKGQQRDTNNTLKNDNNDNNNKIALKEKHLEFVFLLKDEYLKLVNKFGQAGAEMWINKLNAYLGSKGDKYKSHYHTILNWELKDHPEHIEQPKLKRPL